MRIIVNFLVCTHFLFYLRVVKLYLMHEISMWWAKDMFIDIWIHKRVLLNFY